LVGEDQSHNPALAEFFDISQHAKIYEFLVSEIFNMTDSSASEKQSAMQAMLALHCIQD
jgi:hypothetical protein